MAERVPPGRAGLLWLATRLGAAQRGRDLLDHKHQLLGLKQQTLSLALQERRQAWLIANADAQRWSLRVGIISGIAVVELYAASLIGKANVTLIWGNTMGVRHPDRAQCNFPALAPSAAIAANAAVFPAAQAYRKALEAAMNVAVTATALQKIENELQATQRRLSGIEHHHIPRLTRSLHELQFRVDELERQESIVARWAKDRQR